MAIKKVAYMIMAHRDEEHLKELVDALNYCSDFYIYIDGKSEINNFRNKFQPEEYPNVFWVENRHKICWGGWTQTTPIISMLELVLQKEYVRVCFLTGADYPIIAKEQVYYRLIDDLDEEYICATKLSNSGNEKYKKKVTRRWYFDVPFKSFQLQRIIRKCINIALACFPKRSTFLEIDGKKAEVYYGYAYWAITGSCARYLYETFQANKKIASYFKYSYAPIEMMPHTIILNSEYRNRCKEYFAFDKVDCMVYAPLHYVIYGGNGTKIMNERDFDTLISSDKVFFQKSDSKISKKLIEKLKCFHGNG